MGVSGERKFLVAGPFSAETEEQVMATEKALSKGGAIHRGFSSKIKTRYRNAPDWKTPIELIRRMPEIPKRVRLHASSSMNQQNHRAFQS